jgi:Fungal specific transcription factor domain
MIGVSQHVTSNVAPVSLRATEHSGCYQYVRGTAHLDPLLLENVPFDDDNEASLKSAKFRKIGGGPGEYVEILGSNITDAARHTSVSYRLLETRPRAEMNFLVGSFFEFVHPVFPILDSRVFQASYESSSVEPLLLAAVCILSEAWLSSTHRMTKEVNTSNAEAMLWEHLRASLDQPSITTLQAGLLLLQCPNSSSQQLSSQLISVAFDLGLHRDCSDWMIDSREISSRKRLAWALYAQDKWTSLLHGRPIQMTEANWMVKHLCEDDFDVVAGAEDRSTLLRRHGALLFMQTLILSQLLAEILGTFYTLSAEDEVHASGNSGLRVVLARAKPVQIKLKDWFSSLPAELKMDAQNESQVAYNGILHLAYFATEIALHRCIIRASVAAGTDSYVTHICRSAAKTRLISAMDFVNRLRPSHFQSSWPLASVSNFGVIGSFGVLLRATAPTKEEAEFYCARLEEYRWTLTASSRSADFLSAAIHLLDTSTNLLQYVPEKPEVNEFVSMHPQVLSGDGQASTFGTSQERSAEAFDGFSSPATSMSSEHDFEAMESA